MTVSPLTDK